VRQHRVVLLHMKRDKLFESFDVVERAACAGSRPM
jgi:hypothetical protein